MSCDKTAIILVDHGSRLEQSNALLHNVADAFFQRGDYQIVEPAHMELAEPSIKTAFDQCVRRGAERVVVFPYFLGPGRHWSEDIPRLAAQAAANHPGVQYVVTAPLGLDELVLDVISKRIEGCLQRTTRNGPSCDVCSDSTGCQLLGG